MTDKNVIKRKLLVLGTFSVGKTSLVNRFTMNKFSDIYVPTIGVSIKKKSVELEELIVDLVVWDIADVATFDIIPDHYLSGAHGVILVFDLTRPETLKKTLEGVNSFREKLPSTALLIVGNKSDLLDENEVQTFNDQGILEVHTSAKSGDNVEEMFERLARLTLEA